MKILKKKFIGKIIYHLHYYYNGRDLSFCSKLAHFFLKTLHLLQKIKFNLDNNFKRVKKTNWAHKNWEKYSRLNPTPIYC